MSYFDIGKMSCISLLLRQVDFAVLSCSLVDCSLHFHLLQKQYLCNILFFMVILVLKSEIPFCFSSYFPSFLVDVNLDVVLSDLLHSSGNGKAHKLLH